MADYTNLNSDSLRKLTRIVERRDSLLEEIKKINAQIAAVIGGEPAEAPKASSAPAATGARPGRPAKGAKGPRKGAKVKAAKAPKAPKEPKPAKVKAPKAERKGRTGGLRDAVLSALRTAGAAGIGVQDIAKKIGAKPQNLHVWFSTTGRRSPEIVRVGPGRYALQGQHQQPQA